MVVTVPSVPTNFILAGMWLSWLAFAVYVFGLPLWSKIFMEDLGYWKELCFTPAELIICGDGQNYMEIAERLGRERNGSYVGCGCGEGVFGDWVCPVNVGEVAGSAFSISYFMGTPNGTGLIGALTFVPLLAIWVYGFWTNPSMAAVARSKGLFRENMSESCAFNIIFYTQVAFQLFFAAFLFFTFCSFPKEHELFVELFTYAEIAHFFAVAAVLNCNNNRARIIMGLLVFAIVSFILGLRASSYNKQTAFGHLVREYGFWLSECIVFSTILVVTPLICTLSRDADVPIPVPFPVPVPPFSPKALDLEADNAASLLEEAK